jgi:hypothetical protein
MGGGAREITVELNNFSNNFHLTEFKHFKLALNQGTLKAIWKIFCLNPLL